MSITLLFVALYFSSRGIARWRDAKPNLFRATVATTLHLGLFIVFAYSAITAIQERFLQ